MRRGPKLRVGVPEVSPEKGARSNGAESERSPSIVLDLEVVTQILGGADDNRIILHTK